MQLKRPSPLSRNWTRRVATSISPPHAGRRLVRLSIPLAVLVVLLLLVAPPARAATITVCPLGCDYDNVPDAVAAAAAGDTIDIAAGTFILEFGSPIIIDKDLTLRGAGADVTILTRFGFDYNSGRIIDVSEGAEVLIEDLTISGGNLLAATASSSRACAGAGSTAVYSFVAGAYDEPMDWNSLTARDTPAVQAEPDFCEAEPASVNWGISVALAGSGGAYITITPSSYDDALDEENQGPATLEGTHGIILRGGGIFNEGQLTLRQVKVSENRLRGTTAVNLQSNDDTEAATASIVDTTRLLGGGIFNAASGALTIERSTISGNSTAITTTLTTTVSIDAGVSALSTVDSYAVTGGGIYNEGSLWLVDSTVSDNTAASIMTVMAYAFGPPGTTEAEAAGTIISAGGIFNAGEMTTVNSTISNNLLQTTATGDTINVYVAGGVLDGRAAPSTLDFTTVAANELDATLTGGGGGAAAGGIVTSLLPVVPAQPPPPPPPPLSPDSLSRASQSKPQSRAPVGVLETFAGIIADNVGLDCASDAPGMAVNTGYSLSGDGSCDIPQTLPALGGLADNGGPTQTHLPVSGSGAINPVPPAVCAAYPLTADQRGEPRPVGGGCEAGAVETAVVTPDMLFSTTTAGVTGDGLPFGPHDILEWDGTAWSLRFDGTAAGLTPNGKAAHNINAFALPHPDGSNDVYIAFAQNARAVPGIPGKVDGTDLVVWTGASFLLAFDGSDVGLAVKSQEKIDGLHILDGGESPINGGDCPWGYMLISTTGPGKVPNYSGGTISFSGEDVLGFCAASLGDNTAGLWHKVLDGSDQGMPKNSTDSISLSADGNVLYLTTRGAFNVDTATGGHSMVYGYDLVNEEFFGPLFSAPAEGLAQKVDGLQYDVAP